jgi:hypothetical protein
MRLSDRRKAARTSAPRARFCERARPTRQYNRFRPGGRSLVGDFAYVPAAPWSRSRFEMPSFPGVCSPTSLQCRREKALQWPGDLHKGSAAAVPSVGHPGRTKRPNGVEFRMQLSSNSRGPDPQYRRRPGNKYRECRATRAQRGPDATAVASAASCIEVVVAGTVAADQRSVPISDSWRTPEPALGSRPSPSMR